MKKIPEDDDTIQFRGELLIKSDVQVIQELENTFKIKLKQGGNMLSYKTKNQHIVELNLNTANIELLPNSLIKLTNIENLAIDIDVVENFSDIVPKFPLLKTLSLIFSDSASIPDSIGDLQFINTLYLIGNKLTKLPETVVHLTSVETINIVSNSPSLPKELIFFLNLKRIYFHGKIENILIDGFTVDKETEYIIDYLMGMGVNLYIP